jgi:hypothetical protein
MLPGEILDARAASILNDMFNEQPALAGLVRHAGNAQAQPVELLKVRCDDGEFHGEVAEGCGRRWESSEVGRRGEAGELSRRRALARSESGDRRLNGRR